MSRQLSEAVHGKSANRTQGLNAQVRITIIEQNRGNRRRMLWGLQFPSSVMVSVQFCWLSENSVLYQK
mgnify:CR=1 FL=1